MDLRSIVRKNILTLEPYRCARDDYSSGVLLDANENALGPPMASTIMEELERYPSPYQIELKDEIAKFRGVERDNIFLGVGSDEGIDILMRIFCVPGQDEILTLPPTYGMYKVSATTNDLKNIMVPLTPEFQLDLDKIAETVAAHPHIKLIFICSPNNPTGNSLNREDIVHVIRSNPGKIVVVDEAYIDFSASPSFCSEINSHPNLVVIQTLSKSFGLAGIRLGMSFAQKDIVRFMNIVKAPYNISQLTSKTASEAFTAESLERMRQNVVKIKEERARVVSELSKFPTVRKIHPSDANFVLFQIDDAFNVYKTVADNGVVSRYRGSEIHCADCIRLTIGTPEQNDLFLQRLREVTKA